jgi:hypothetical protein
MRKKIFFVLIACMVGVGAGIFTWQSRPPDATDFPAIERAIGQAYVDAEREARKGLEADDDVVFRRPEVLMIVNLDCTERGIQRYNRWHPFSAKKTGFRELRVALGGEPTPDQLAISYGFCPDTK